MLEAVYILAARLAVGNDAAGVKVDINDGTVTVPCNGFVLDPRVPLIPPSKPTGFEMPADVAWLDSWLDAWLDSWLDARLEAENNGTTCA